MSIFKSLIIISTLLLVSIFSTYGRSVVVPSHKTDSVAPAFKGGVPALMTYFRKEIEPILSDCAKDSVYLPTSLKMILTIDPKGKVVDVEFPKSQMDNQCKCAIQDKLLEMKGWEPGTYAGKRIVDKYPWYINSILWQ